MIYWKDFALDPVLGAILSDEVFEEETRGFALMDERNTALQETRRFNGSARMVERLNTDGLDLAAVPGKEAPNAARSRSSENTAPTGAGMQRGR